MRVTRFTGYVQEFARDTRQVLEIGCGAGEQIASLAQVLPCAHFTGVDLSATNIAAAERVCARFSPRIRLVAADYLDFGAETRFDLIVSYSTLQLIPGSSETLFAKIASELEPGGLLMNAMPYDCLFNRTLLSVRRGFRAIRSPLTDAAVFRIGRLLHGHKLDDVMLRQRVEYMYEVPQRLDSLRLRSLMRERCALEFVIERDEPHASIAQAKHRLTVFRKHGHVA